MNVLRTLGLALATSTLCACSANHNAIYRHDMLNPDQSAIITVDAKQRAILVGNHRTTVEQGGKQTQTDIQRFCSEPSPDVFSVVAQALSAGGSFGKAADPQSIQLALSTAFSSSEQGSTIPRTQTVNMLRELMFRTCERYLNGGITGAELPIQAARDQRLMVSILAIESLTGAVTPKPVVIGANANGSAGASGAEAAVRLDDAYKNLRAKTTAQQARQNEYNEITTESKHCEQIADAVAKKEDDKLSQELKDKRAECEAASSALVAAKQETVDSAAHYASMKSTVTSSGVPASTSAQVMTPKADGGLDRAHDEAVSNVAHAVESIVLANFAQSEFDFMCIKILSGELNKNVDVRAKCVEHVSESFKRTSELANALALGNYSPAEVDRAQQTIGKRVDELFDLFWAKVSTDGKTASTPLVDQLKNKISWWPKCFDADQDIDTYRACFNQQTAPKQRRLSR